MIFREIATMVQHGVEAMIDLIYPRLCAACGFETPLRKGIFCLKCLAELPETQYHTLSDNPFTMHFWGRIQLQAGAAFLHFVPDGMAQTLIHNIKYKGKRNYAEQIGCHYGAKLIKEQRFQSAELIIPVPLYWKKERKRGFNQSAAFAQGLSESIGIPTMSTALKRIRHTETQTKKSREDRIENLNEAFQVTSPWSLENKHVLLVDDVLTTGATLEACALQILKLPGTKLSMVTIAMGKL